LKIRVGRPLDIGSWQMARDRILDMKLKSLALLSHMSIAKTR